MVIVDCWKLLHWEGTIPHFSGQGWVLRLKRVHCCLVMVAQVTYWLPNRAHQERMSKQGVGPLYILQVDNCLVLPRRKLEDDEDDNSTAEHSAEEENASSNVATMVVVLERIIVAVDIVLLLL